MSTQGIGYSRMAKRRTPAGSSDLWLSADHLLLVQRHWWTESYLRFRLSEIGSILIVERPSWRGLQAVGLAATAILWAVAIFVSNDLARKILLGFPLSLALVWQAIDLFRGAYCRVELATAVSTVRLAPLRRMRAAVRFADRITPLIEEAQGRLAPELPATPPSGEDSDAAWTLSGTGAAMPAAVPPPLPAVRRGKRGIVVQTILFGSTLALGAILVGMRGEWPSQLISIVWMGLLLTIILGVMVTLTGKGAWLRTMAAGAAAVAIFTGIGSFAFFVSVIAEGARNKTSQAQMQSQLRQTNGEKPGSAFAAIGIGGLALTLAARRRPDPAD